jgi:hypothetical protein
MSRAGNSLDQHASIQLLDLKCPEMKLPAYLYGHDLWAITSYFNPVRYRSRLSNFRTFRERLKVPLVAVELSYGDDFELQEPDADILIQLRGGAALWQKERLLNLALQALPESCQHVAWLDCDILFGSEDWAESTVRLLERFAIIQLFKNVHYLPPGCSAPCALTDAELTRPSASFSISSGIPPTTVIGHSLNTREGTSAPGFAWAARRKLLDQHHFFDACVLGGGDRAMNCAATQCFDVMAKRHYWNKQQQDWYAGWAKPFFETIRGEIGYLEGDIFHLWHGSMRDRNTRTRHEGFQQYQFNPYVDIAIGANGCWQWNTEKPHMHDYVGKYFSSRREDG